MNDELWLHHEQARRAGFSVSYLDWVCRALEAGLGDHVLLSHDCMGYDPAQPNGGALKSYTYLAETFVPKLRARGVDDGSLHMLLHDNPFRAYARVQALA